MKPVVPTNPEDESTKGRIAFWLDPEDLAWLSTTCRCPPHASEEETERCVRIRFRASAALHKFGTRKNATKQ